MPVEWMLGSRSYNNFNYAAINPIAFNDLWICKKNDLSVYADKIEFSDLFSHRSHMALHQHYQSFVRSTIF